MKDAPQKATGFLEAFQSLDDGIKNRLADIKFPLLLALATLQLAQDQTNMQYLSIEHIVAALEAAGVCVKRVPLARALARAGNRVNRRLINDEPHFRIMIQGSREVKPILESGGLELLYIDGDKPRTARKNLGDILADLSGTIRICDPYYGLRTLESLEHIPKKCKVMFLTAQTKDDKTRLAGPIRDFKKERPAVELRLFASANALHDRYVLSDNKILLVGHGLKDIGGRESFIVSIPKTLAPDMLIQVRAGFDAKWNQASPI